MTPRRVAIIGVDCLTPQLLFDRYLAELPTFRSLVERGPWGTLRSTIPPITVPAWTCMATSQDPGQLGLYGFRNRAAHGYGALEVADASWVKAPTLWQLLSRRRRPSIVLGVPLTYPPRPLVGELVSGIPIPSGAPHITFPAPLSSELDGLCASGRYLVDVEEFRTARPRELVAQLARLRDARFDVAEALVSRRRWDLFFMVELGVDRLHHAFWAHCHPDHPSFVPDSAYADVIRDYYVALDARVGRLLERLGDEAAVMIVSDHGARTMRGGLRINEWLLREGLLSLRRRPDEPVRLRPEDVDWGRTTAWADGGYYARVFLNVKGREPNGLVPPDELEGVVADLKARLESMRGPGALPLGNRVFRPREIYREVRGAAPDLIVYLGDLDYRSNATVLPEPGPPPGPEGLFALENDIGVDGANHAEEGVLLFRPARGAAAPPGRIAASLYDIAPTALRLLGEEIPSSMIGRPLDSLAPREG